MLWMVLVFAVAFIVTFLATPRLIRKLTEAGIVGRDMHKEGEVKVPEMGGIAIIFGISAGIFASIPFLDFNLVYLFAAFLTVLMAALVGICDDLFGLKFRTKSILPVFTAVPLMVVQAGVHMMNVPFVGVVDFGLIYPIIVIPIAITIVANASNMLAGYNGLEAGMGAIACAFMALAGFLLGETAVVILMLSTLGACLAFLKFNVFPARIFVGDVGTFVIGVSIGAAAIIGNMEIIGAIVIAPYIINGIITVADILRKKRIQRFSTVKDGVLVPPKKEYTQTLYFIMQRAFRLTEKKMSYSMWMLGMISGVIAIGVLLLHI
jgi:UDP-N-acetylglucosamine--dolichyl-phosphate N-acetylglucosaminephosphotransferase